MNRRAGASVACRVRHSAFIKCESCRSGQMPRPVAIDPAARTRGLHRFRSSSMTEALPIADMLRMSWRPRAISGFCNAPRRDGRSVIGRDSQVARAGRKDLFIDVGREAGILTDHDDAVVQRSPIFPPVSEQRSDPAVLTAVPNLRMHLGRQARIPKTLFASATPPYFLIAR